MNNIDVQVSIGITVSNSLKYVLVNVTVESHCDTVFKFLKRLGMVVHDFSPNRSRWTQLDLHSKF